MIEAVEIRSARDGLKLTLSDLAEHNSPSPSDSFVVTIQSCEVRAEARASSFMAADLGDYFQNIAENWRGWSGEKKWATLENDFELAATADNLGHVRLEFFLRSPYTGYQWELRGALELEAGQLDSIASEVRLFWSAPGAA